MHRSHHEPPHALQFVDSATGRVVLCRSTKIIPTRSTGAAGSLLCRANIDGTGCVKGNECPMVHCITKEHVWEPIAVPPTQSPDAPYPPGWLMRVYDADLTTYMEIPSSFFLPTAGSEEFISEFNKRGEQVKQQFKICRPFRETVCSDGAMCADLHCTAQDLSQFKCSVTHTNDETSLQRFPCLKQGFIVRVYVQNSPNEYDDFSSERVLYTMGAEKYLEAFRNEGGHIPRKKMQHCAHFRIKRMCRLGAGCKFIHAVPLVHPRLDFDIGALSMSTSGPTTPRSESEYSTSNGDGTFPRCPSDGDRRHIRVKVRPKPGARATSPTYQNTQYCIDDSGPLDDIPPGLGAALASQSSASDSRSATLSPYTTHVVVQGHQPVAPPMAQSLEEAPGLAPVPLQSATLQLHQQQYHHPRSAPQYTQQAAPPPPFGAAGAPPNTIYMPQVQPQPQQQVSFGGGGQASPAAPNAALHQQVAHVGAPPPSGVSIRVGGVVMPSVAALGSGEQPSAPPQQHQIFYGAGVAQPPPPYYQ